MSRNPKLSDLQLILLANAAQREGGNIFPLPESIVHESERVGRAIPPLLRRALVEQVPVTQRARTWREEDQQLVGLAITNAGRTIIGSGEDPESPADAGPCSAINKKEGSSNLRPGTKAELVFGLLRRPEGATLLELVDATGWLPHTTRAALTGLRKKGHIVDKTKRDDATCYRIAEAA
ncbi:MAG: DUF3489 domain-containing protein [Pseudomonadota bacterium]|nr:DUF3489 domain-containing protein [Pseudomonadota bacterium]